MTDTETPQTVGYQLDHQRDPAPNYPRDLRPTAIGWQFRSFPVEPLCRSSTTPRVARSSKYQRAAYYQQLQAENDCWRHRSWPAQAPSAWGYSCRNCAEPPREPAAPPAATGQQGRRWWRWRREVRSAWNHV